MALERFRLNSKGISKLLKSTEVKSDLQRRAEAVAQAARGRAEGVLDHGEKGIVADSYTGKTRAGATVIGVTLRDEQRTRALGSAIDAAGD